ncbi:hypothetical protein BDR06DRAFT_1009949 [Suillus hirtellus]|nr:hypothetical protein BDR06DRAFT_1009949 [Suillus hirtellus]
MSLTGPFTKLPQMCSGLPMNKSKPWMSPPSDLNSLITSPRVHVPKSAKSFNTFLLDKVPDQKVLEDLEAMVKARLDLNDNQDGLSLGRCAVILEALQNPKPNTFVINDITPAEYAVTLAFISEEPDCGIRAKFNYFQDTQELQIMAPLPIHEQPTTHLFKAITKYTDAIPYDKRLIDVTLHLNHRMQNKDFTNIPDLQLSVAVHPPENDEDDDEAEIEILRPVIKWVGECRLSSDDNSMIHKLRLMTDSSGETDADSHFDFNSKNAETFAEGTIYPKIKMGDIKHVLSEAAESLKEYIISLMEGMGLEEPAIQSACESRPVWDPIWEAALNQISTIVYLTAYCRYVNWHHHKYDKHKLPVAQATTSTSLSSNPTASSSTDQPHTPSTRLSIDVEPEHSAKRAKVDNGKVSKAKAKKSKKAKERVDDL